MIRVQDMLCIRPSPLHDRAAEYCQTNDWVRTGNTTQVAVYSSVLEEYWAAKSDAVLFDSCTLNTYRVEGSGAALGLEHLIAGSIADLTQGQFLPALWCTDTGHVIAHGFVFCERQDSFLIVCDVACRAWIEDTVAGYACRLTVVSDTTARIGLEGPLALTIFDAMGLTLGRELQDLTFFDGVLRGLRIGLARLTPDRFMLWTGTEDGRALWDRLMRAGAPFGIKPAGVRAQTILRLEKGEVQAGTDYASALRAGFAAEATRPEAVGLERLINRSKTGFVGWKSLAVPPPPLQRRLVRIKAGTDQPLDGAILVGRDQRPVGYTTSSGFIPSLGASLAFAWIEGPDSVGPLGLVLPPNAGSGGKLRKIACALEL